MWSQTGVFRRYGHALALAAVLCGSVACGSDTLVADDASAGAGDTVADGQLDNQLDAGLDIGPSADLGGADVLDMTDTLTAADEESGDGTNGADLDGDMLPDGSAEADISEVPDVALAPDQAGDMSSELADAWADASSEVDEGPDVPDATDSAYDAADVWSSTDMFVDSGLGSDPDGGTDALVSSDVQPDVSWVPDSVVVDSSAGSDTIVDVPDNAGSDAAEDAADANSVTLEESGLPPSLVVASGWMQSPGYVLSIQVHAAWAPSIACSSPGYKLVEGSVGTGGNP